MDELRATVAMAEVLGVKIHREKLARLVDHHVPGQLPDDLVEWSLNQPKATRGTLRVSTWTRDHDVATRELAHLVSESARGHGDSVMALRDALPRDDIEGIGLSFGDWTELRTRWWQLARIGRGAKLAQAMVAARSELGDAYELLCAACGGPSQCTAVGTESAGGALTRVSLYFRLPSPAATVRVLEHVGCRPSLRGNLFFKGLLGMAPETTRPWPKVWIGRSLDVGQNVRPNTGPNTRLNAGQDVQSAARAGGWKFYYFARGDDRRPSDAVLLDAVDATPRMRAAYDALRMNITVPASLIQLVGLTFADADADADNRDSEPAWTLYLAQR